MSDSCIFCQIATGNAPAYKVAETTWALAFMDIMPVNPGHILVIPKNHYSTLHEVPEDEAVEVFRLAHRVEKALRNTQIPCDGTHLMQNNGGAAFQEVHHAHFHIIPRLFNDQVKFRLGQQAASQQALQKLAEEIKEVL